MALPGVEVLPPCRWCGAPLVWRGDWECEGCFARHPLHPDYALADFPRSLPPEALAGVPMEQCSGEAAELARVFSAGEGDNSTGPRLSRPDGKTCRSYQAEGWGSGVEALTSFKRRALACRLLVRGARPTVGGTVWSPWHEARARSLGERWQRIGECGAMGLVAEHADGRVVPLEQRCGDWRACHRCRERRTWELQRDGDRVASAARRLYRLECSRWYRGREGRWSERMLTLTVPHSGSVAEDARIYREAWPRFMRMFLRHLRRDRGVDCHQMAGRKCSVIPWRRAVEVASTREAHFHGHVWMLSPFVDQVLVHVWWGRALIAAGLPAERLPAKQWSEVAARDPRVHRWLGRPSDVPWPVAHVKGGHMADYVGKVGLKDYVVKTDGVKASLSPVHAANAYEALSGLRVVQWGAGWSPGAEASDGGWRVRRATEAERSEWYARVARALGVGEDAGARKQAQKMAPESESEPLLWARDGPELATAPEPLVAALGQVSLLPEWEQAPGQ